MQRFMREAHRRGLRVITELVVNHTSDQHPWFQRAWRASPGSRWRNFYVAGFSRANPQRLYLPTVIDERFQNRMLLAEANQWPEDAAAYLGDGTNATWRSTSPSCRGSSWPPRRRTDILEQTPAIPEPSQWPCSCGTTTNLTLEMVTDEERDCMYLVYAHDRQARINLAVRLCVDLRLC